MLQHGYPLVDDLQLYIPEKGNAYTLVETGDHFPFVQRPFNHRTFVFPLTLNAGEHKTYFLRQKTDSAMNLALTIWSPSAFKEWSEQEDRMLMFYYGIMVIMIVNYLAMYLLLRHLSYLNFTMFITFILLFIMMQNGAAYQFLMPDNPVLANLFPPLFLCMLDIFGNRFMVVFLQLKKNAPVIKKIIDIELVVFVVFALSVLTLPFFDIYAYIMSLTAFLTIILILTAFITGVILVLKKQRSAYIFTLISIGLFAGSIIYLLKSFGILPTSFVTTWSVIIGSSTILIFLSIALVDRINSMRKGLKVLSTNLEKEVNERSIELLLSEIGAKISGEFHDKGKDIEADIVHSSSIKELIEKERDLSIMKLSQDIGIISNINELMDLITAKVIEISGAGRVLLFISNEEQEMELSASCGDDKNSGKGYSMNIIVDVYDSGNYLISSDKGAGGFGDENKPDNWRSILCIPIKSDEEVLGVFYLEKSIMSGEFTEKDADLLMEFSENITSVLENAFSYQFIQNRGRNKKEYSITSNTEEKIKNAIDYINENYTCDISREGLAASLDISPNHLGKFFKIYTGKKISEYINELRIKDAANRMKDASNDENIIDIAFSVGFESLSTFNRAFLKVMGTTPTKYKDLK